MFAAASVAAALLVQSPGFEPPNFEFALITPEPGRDALIETPFRQASNRYALYSDGASGREFVADLTAPDPMNPMLARVALDLAPGRYVLAASGAPFERAFELEGGERAIVWCSGRDVAFCAVSVDAEPSAAF